MSYHNTNSAVNRQGTTGSQGQTRQRTTNAQGQTAPSGYHYMPDGSLMLNAEHTKLYGSKIIQSFNLDLSDLPSTGENRAFSIIGDAGAEFILEVKDSTTGYYYNFFTNTFQAKVARLEKSIVGNVYNDTIIFPAVTGSDDKYNVYLFAKVGTKHIGYKEVRFLDGTVDINSSTGSKSLMMEKVIYQYSALTLTLQGQSLNSTVTGAFPTSTISIERGKNLVKQAFTLTATSLAASSYNILKQPTVSEVLSFESIVIGSTPEKLQGENIYPAVSNTDTVDGAISSGVKVVMDNNVADKMKVGDRITGNAALSAATVTVAALNPDGDNVKEFSMSEAIDLANNLELSFSNQKNFRWSVDNINNLVSGASVLSGDQVLANTLIAKYEDTVTVFEGTERQEIIIKNQAPALDTKSIKPTIVNGVVTTQQGSIIFNQQQELALGGNTITIGGYGDSLLLSTYDYDVRFTDLAITLTAMTTTTTSVVSSSTTIPVASVKGVLPSITTVSGIGIDPSVANPTVSSRSVTNGAGNIVLSAAQTLESGITLTLGNTGQVATITGNIEVLTAGTADKTIYFDLEKLISIA